MLTTTLIACQCNHCDGYITFEERGEGTQVTCPHCGLDTILFIPVTNQPPQIPTAPARSPGGLSKLIHCHACASLISRKAAACPQCGEPLGSIHRGLDVFLGVLAALTVFAIGAAVFGATIGALLSIH